jgi:NitT/TauT family transport system substrate-binding protein
VVSKISRRETMALLGGTMAFVGAPRAMAAEPSLVRVSLLPIYSVAPHFAAEKLGYFAEEGITVTTQPIQTGAVGIPGLMSGSFDVLYTNTVSVLTALERGIDIRILAEATRVPAAPPEGLALFRRKGDQVASGKDLEGKTLAINARFTLQWLTMNRWIKKTGGDVSKVNFREIPLPSMLDALKSKQVDAAFMLDPYKMVALSDPTVELFAWPSTTVIPGLSTGVWVVSGKWADASPEIARGYQRAYMKGGKWVNDNIGQPNYLELVAGFTKMDPKLIAEMPRVPQEMNISIDAIHGIGDVMQEFDLLKSKVDVSPKIFK